MNIHAHTHIRGRDGQTLPCQPGGDREGYLLASGRPNELRRSCFIFSNWPNSGRSRGWSDGGAMRGRDGRRSIALGLGGARARSGGRRGAASGMCGRLVAARGALARPPTKGRPGERKVRRWRCYQLERWQTGAQGGATVAVSSKQLR